MVICPQAHHAFDTEGRLKNDAVAKQISAAVAGMQSFAEKQLA